MIDIHNHLLPGIDDGAADMDEALALARLAVADGITHLVCTPHMHPGLYDNDRAAIEAALANYRAALAEAGIALEVAAAAEVRFGLEVMTGATGGDMPLLGEWAGCGVLLLEFPHTEIPFGAERLTGWLIDRDILPMIAHPERNRDIVNDPHRLTAFIEQGCLTQVTASALTGQFGERTQRCAEHLILTGQANCIASDAHNITNRVPCLGRARAQVDELAGAEVAQALCLDQPWQIVAGHFAAG
ncbi:tyrosine-protein phosphatase [Spiribacter salinus]|uniref:tyrosine-protein phosphatase n=1 Tax=Spiribacter salinus TaxID=1335746 RepID=UPI001C945D8A|nr:CpsB/CapC family capsule biosynthesis tyrosine phosphatase [Spiribacter salinus]MBY5267735.1 capsular biosynthesis protein [Spiribacter salinus]